MKRAIFASGASKRLARQNVLCTAGYCGICMAFGADVRTSGGMGSFSRSGRYHLPQPFVRAERGGPEYRSNVAFVSLRAASATSQSATTCVIHTKTETPNPPLSTSNKSSFPTATTCKSYTSVGRSSAKIVEGTVEYPSPFS